MIGYRTNFFLTIIARCVNIGTNILFAPLLLKKMGKEEYGFFVLLFSIINILFQFSHVYTSYLKVLNYKGGYSYVFSRLKTCFIISTFIFIFSLVFKFLLFPVLSIIILVFMLFIYQAIYYNQGHNSYANYIFPVYTILINFYVYIHGNINWFDFLFISQCFLYVIVIVGFLFVKYERGLEYKYLYSRYDCYIIGRSKQVFIFSFVTILQTNIEKIIIPIFMGYSTLAIYNVVTMIPSRMSLVWGSISALYSKEIHSGIFDNVYNYFKYGGLVFFAFGCFFIVYDYYVLQYFVDIVFSKYEYVYIIFVFVSLIQSFGFICFPIYSYKNRINDFSVVNLGSLMTFLLLLCLFTLLDMPDLFSISMSVLFSKLFEFVNAYKCQNMINKPLVKYWFIYSIVMIVVLVLKVLYLFFR